MQLIRGPENTFVRLQILPASASPGSQEAHLALKRDKITLESQAAKKEVHTLHRGDKELKVGVIEVPSFYQDFQARMKGDADYRSTTRDVHRLIDELKAEKIDSLVIDLRDNGGGHLSEATSLVGLFVERGPVVQLREIERPHRGARRSRAGRCLGRAARRPRQPGKRFRVGDLRGRDPGLPAWPRRRPADLRQGFGTEPLPA